MTRREEIAKASICQYQIIGTIGEQEAFKNGFVKGAEWADKTMIEKDCQWMEENLREVHPRTGEEVCIVNLNRFREAMEE